MSLRVLAWNIHSGIGLDGRLDLERIARLLRAARPDLVALTEVSRNWPGRGRVDQARRLAELAGFRRWLFAPAFRRGWAAFGNAFLSPHRLESAAALTLPPARRSLALLGLAHRPEPRLLLCARLEWPPAAEPASTGQGAREGHPRGTFLRVPVAVTHLGLSAREREAQSRAVAAWLEEAGPLAILAGDLNAALEARELAPLLRGMADACRERGEPTYPADRPAARIDHLLVGPAWRVVEAGVWRDPAGEVAVASDHLPVLAALDPVAPPPG
ncbi:MAG: endonuclease/exonuclease/phosphatase family protein [Bacillota bacterium]|nr:endonuclease/exonuclease/phosphatase family protein [Bacillota bacterium]